MRQIQHTKRVPVTVHLKPELARALRVRAAENNERIGETLDRWIRKGLQEEPAPRLDYSVFQN